MLRKSLEAEDVERRGAQKREEGGGFYRDTRVYREASNMFSSSGAPAKL